MPRKKTKTCVVCGKASVGRVCRDCYERRSNCGYYGRHSMIADIEEKEIEYENEYGGIGYQHNQYSYPHKINKQEEYK